MNAIHKIGTFIFILLLLLLTPSGCTLKLTTDLSKLVGIDNPEKLMGSQEAQQIATKIGEGMGTKIMEGEILAEDMGKGLGNVLLEPQTVAIIDDPVSVDMIEKSGIVHIREGNFSEAIASFKRTNNLAKLEELALILFDKGKTEEASNLHQYLIHRKWPIQPSYLVAKKIEREGLTTIHNEFLKVIDPESYNHNYNRRNYGVFDAIPHLDHYVNNNSLTKQAMLEKLNEAPVIILADAYFVGKQHDVFLEIMKSLDQGNLIIGLERPLQKLKGNREKANMLHYLPIFAWIGDHEIPTFIHGPEREEETNHVFRTIDFYQWDKSLAEKTSGLVKEGKQVVIIIGDTHASPDHLPFLIAEMSGMDPTLVIQNPLNLSIEDILEGRSDEQLTTYGLRDDMAIRIGNDFYIHTGLPREDLKQYIKLFNLDHALTIKQESHSPPGSSKIKIME